MLATLTSIVRDAVTTAGYPGILLAMVAENLFPPIPSELVLPLAGYEVSQGSLEFFLTVLAATAGSLIGALILYALGRYGGRPIFDRWGRVLRVSTTDLDRAEHWFDRWGDWVVLVARVIPLARSVVSIPAGMMHMPVLRFALLTTLGSLLWNFLLVGAGYQLGARWTEVTDLVSRFSSLMLVVAVIAIVGCGIWLWRRRPSTPSSPSSPSTSV